MEGAFDRDPFQENQRFDTVAELGRGAFGAVYLVNDKTLGRKVAAKVLHNTSASALALFKQEFRSLADIVSPYLIQFYELFSDGQQWFFTMEYIDGLNFKDYVLQGFPHSPQASSVPAAPAFSFEAQTLLRPQAKLEAQTQRDPSAEQIGEKIQRPEQHERLRRAFCQLVAGIDYLHSQGKLHRDLKPSNVLVCRDGRVVLLDFGLVADLRSKDEDNSEYQSSSSGTPIYMSPEQAEGDELDEASDWYSLGVMLYEVLAGRPPFTGRLLKLIMSKTSKDPEPISRLAYGASDEILQVCQQLIQRDPGSRPRGKIILKTLGVEGRLDNVADVRHQHQHLLIGRDQYFRQMLDYFQSVQNGQSRLLFVHGPSGFGKSHLIEHFLQHVKENHKDALILSGRCFQQESMPFKAWDQPVDSLSRFLTEYSETAKELVPEDCVCLMRLFPVLENVPAYEELDIDGIDIADPKEIRRRAFKAMRHLLRTLSEKRSIVIYMDDVHWGDLDSQLLIEEVLKSPESPPLLLLCSYRDADAEVSTFLKRALTLPSEHIEVGGLSQKDIAELAQSILGKELSPGQIESLAKETGGSPYFITELLLNASLEQLSDREQSLQLDDMIRARARELPDHAQRILELVAVAGQPLGQQLVQSALRGSLDPKDIGMLRSQHFIRVRQTEDSLEWTCYHDRIRESILHALEKGRRERIHLALANNYDALSPVDYGLVAFHLREAGEILRAGEYTLQAAEHANQQLAFDRAAGLFRLALDSGLLSKSVIPGTFAKLGDSLTNAGRGREAGEAYLKAAEGMEGDGATLDLRQKAAQQFVTSGHIDIGLQIIREVLADVGLQLPNYGALELAAILARDLKFRFRGTKFKQRSESEIPKETLLKIDTCWTVFVALNTVDFIAAVDFCMRMLIFALDAGEPRRIARAMAIQAYIDANLGQMSRARQIRRSRKLINEATEMAEALDDPYVTGFVASLTGVCQFTFGEFKEGEVSNARAVELLRDKCQGVPWELDTAHCFHLWNLRFQGKIAEYSKRLPPLLEEAQSRGDLYAILVLGVTNWNFYLMYADRVEDAAEQVAANSLLCRKMVSRSAGMHVWAELMTRVDRWIYRGKGEEAWAKLDAGWKELVDLQVLDIQFCRTEAWSGYGRAALAAAETDVENRAQLLKKAGEAVSALKNEKVVHGTPWGDLIQAGIHYVSGKTDLAIEMLKTLEKRCLELDMGLFAKVCLRHRGKLLGANGEALVAKADTFMTQQGIVNPGKIAELYAPGFERT